MKKLSPIKDPFAHKIHLTMDELGMLGKQERILIGISGGPDSVALTRVLLDLGESQSFSMGLAHLNHGLRGEESLRDEVFVREFAKTQNLPLTVENQDIKSMAKDTGLSLEEAGRNARYDFFSRTAKTDGFTQIALGHNWDDHVELVLMNIIRGTGTRGLRGIPPIRSGHIIRPLIQTPKMDILDYLNRIGQDFVMDTSNTDPAFLRNRVRHRLIPMLEKEFNPDIKTGLNRLSQILSMEDDFMTEQTDLAFKTVVTKAEGSKITLSISNLINLHPAVANRILRRSICQIKQNLRQISHTHIQGILCLMQSAGSGKSLDLPGQIRVYKTKDRLCIKKEDLPLRELGRIQKAKKQNVTGNTGEKT